MSNADKRYLDNKSIEKIRARFVVEKSIDEALTWKLKRRRGEDYYLPSMKELEKRLKRFIQSNVDYKVEIGDLARLPGGGSKEMFRFKLQRKNFPDQELILRMNPGESIVETHRLREFEIIDAMSGIVPVPEVFWVDTNGEILGNGGMVCSLINGVAKPTLVEDESGSVSGIGAGFPKKMREPLFNEFVEHLVKIHQYDWSKSELSSFDVPTKNTTQAAEWSVNHWSRVWEEDSFEDHPVITLSRKWLEKNLPKTSEIRIVHNDYRNGNFMFDEQSFKITAILDWELAHLGDVHEDLAWILFPGFSSPDENGQPLVCGLASHENFIQRYEKLSGFKIDPKKLYFYTFLNLYKLAVLGTASNARAASDKQTHLDVMMNFSTGLGCSALSGLYQMLRAGGE